MTALAVPMLAFAPQLIRAFDPSAHPALLSAGTSYLRVNALFLPLLAVAMVTNGTLRGAGDTRPGLVGTLVGRALIVVPLAQLLALHLGFGVAGVWWALCVGTAVQAAWVYRRWRGGRWVRVALEGSRLYRLHLHALPGAAQARFLDEVRTPAMGAGATEHVTTEGVLYTGGETQLTVRFCMATSSWAEPCRGLCRGPPRHAPRPPRASPMTRRRNQKHRPARIIFCQADMPGLPGGVLP